MRTGSAHFIINVFIAAVWFINGLFCKLLDMVPRHRRIVAAILGESNSRPLVMLIGSLEVGMVIWILSGIKSRVNAILQIVVIATMNILECLLVPELLLWGRFNASIAFAFIVLIWYNEFVVQDKKMSIQ